VPKDTHEQLAFYINAYNAFTLALVAQQLPHDQSTWKRWSIKDAGGWYTSVWNYYTFELAGTRVTLDHLEHTLLRPLGEPRIHFAINCASRSCPVLSSNPYIGAELISQLDEAVRRFTRNPTQMRLHDGVIMTNPILSWFADDFTASGGVAPFLIPYTQRPELANALKSGVKVTYFIYDWSLNMATAAATP
jgi:hypothetical protein